MRESRKEVIRFRLTTEELESVDELAWLEGEKRSEFIRTALVERGERLAIGQDVEKYGLKAAYVLGLIRRQCDAPDGVCREGVRSMAERLRIHTSTVCRIIYKLEDAGEIRLSPSKRWTGSRDIRLTHLSPI